MGRFDHTGRHGDDWYGSSSPARVQGLIALDANLFLPELTERRVQYGPDVCEMLLVRAQYELLNRFHHRRTLPVAVLVIVNSKHPTTHRVAQLQPFLTYIHMYLSILKARFAVGQQSHCSKIRPTHPSPYRNLPPAQA